MVCLFALLTLVQAQIYRSFGRLHERRDLLEVLIQDDTSDDTNHHVPWSLPHCTHIVTSDAEGQDYTRRIIYSRNYFFFQFPGYTKSFSIKLLSYTH